MRTPLYYATIGGEVLGLACAIGSTILFFPDDTAAVLIVSNPAVVTLKTPVPDLLHNFLCETRVEPRFAALAPGRRGGARSTRTTPPRSQFHLVGQSTKGTLRVQWSNDGGQTWREPADAPVEIAREWQRRLARLAADLEVLP